MKATATTQIDIPSTEIARSLACATAEEFADVWLKFHGMVNDQKLHEIAKEMAPSQGGNRKVVFKRIATLISFYETLGETKY